jgi:hypothetical protein
MALTEQRILKSVEVMVQASTINVLWVDQVLRDGELVVETNHRKAYTIEQKDDFLNEVDGAEIYLLVAGW